MTPAVGDRLITVGFRSIRKTHDHELWEALAALLSKIALGASSLSSPLVEVLQDVKRCVLSFVGRPVQQLAGGLWIDDPIIKPLLSRCSLGPPLAGLRANFDYRVVGSKILGATQ